MNAKEEEVEEDDSIARVDDTISTRVPAAEVHREHRLDGKQGAQQHEDIFVGW